MHISFPPPPPPESPLLSSKFPADVFVSLPTQTSRKLSRRAIARSSSHSSQRDTPGTDIPPIRLAGGTVPVSSGPAPRASEPANNGTDTANGGAAGRRPGEVSAANNNGAAGDSGKTKSSVSAAGHTYDKGYSKWAKFDIDAALRSVDTEGPETDVKVRDVKLIRRLVGSFLSHGLLQMTSAAAGEGATTSDDNRLLE